jgi:hypothetical protein
MTANSWFKTLSGARLLLAFLIIAPVLTLSAFGQTQQPIYPVPIITSTVVPGAAIGDFNGDGQADQAYISANKTFTVLLSQSSNAPVPIVSNGLKCLWAFDNSSLSGHSHERCNQSRTGWIQQHDNRSQ